MGAIRPFYCGLKGLGDTDRNKECAALSLPSDYALAEFSSRRLRSPTRASALGLAGPLRLLADSSHAYEKAHHFTNEFDLSGSIA